MVMNVDLYVGDAKLEFRKYEIFWTLRFKSRVGITRKSGRLKLASVWVRMCGKTKAQLLVIRS